MKREQSAKAPTDTTAAEPGERHGRRRTGRWATSAAVLAALVTLVVVATQRAPAGGSPLLKQDATQQNSTSATADDTQASSKSLRRFSLADVDGRQVMRPTGRKPGVLVFTASNCSPCIVQARSLLAEMRKFGSRAEILTVSIDPGDSSSALRDAFKPAIGNARNYPLAVDQSGQLAPAFGVTATGTEIVYDRAGREVWRGVSSPVSEIGAALRKAGAA